MKGNSGPTYQRYITGPVERFDQKNDMFKRAMWDPAFVADGKKYYGPNQPKDRTGYRLEDYALLNASWYVERRFSRGNQGGNYGLLSWECDDPRVNKLMPDLKLEVDDPERISRRIKKVARLFGASLVGICELDRRWVYSHYYLAGTGEHKPLELPEDIRYAVTMAIEMEYDVIATSPQATANAGSGLGYSRMPFVAGLLAQFIRLLGYKAIPSGNDTALAIPIAVDAGLGQLGRNGLLIAPYFGPRVRLCKVLTDMPLVPDRPVDLGVQDFCDKCKKCADQCPSKAIPFEGRSDKPHNISNSSGVLKWPLNAERCFRFWVANGSSCSVCIRTCPFNKPQGRIHDMTRWTIGRTTRLNRFFIWLDDVFGYGRQLGADDFWEH